MNGADKARNDAHLKEQQVSPQSNGTDELASNRSTPSSLTQSRNKKAGLAGARSGHGPLSSSSAGASGARSSTPLNVKMQHGASGGAGAGAGAGGPLGLGGMGGMPPGLLPPGLVPGAGGPLPPGLAPNNPSGAPPGFGGMPNFPGGPQNAGGPNQNPFLSMPGIANLPPELQCAAAMLQMQGIPGFPPNLANPASAAAALNSLQRALPPNVCARPLLPLGLLLHCLCASTNTRCRRM